MKKRVVRFACAVVLALVGGSMLLGLTAVIYGLATDCPDTAGVYVDCSK